MPKDPRNPKCSNYMLQAEPLTGGPPETVTDSSSLNGTYRGGVGWVKYLLLSSDPQHPHVKAAGSVTPDLGNETGRSSSNLLACQPH